MMDKKVKKKIDMLHSGSRRFASSWPGRRSRWTIRGELKAVQDQVAAAEAELAKLKGESRRIAANRQARRARPTSVPGNGSRYRWRNRGLTQINADKNRFNQLRSSAFIRGCLSLFSDP